MKTLQTHYFNGTTENVSLKAQNGEITIVKPQTGVVSNFGNPHIKRKFWNTGWRSF